MSGAARLDGLRSAMRRCLFVGRKDKDPVSVVANARLYDLADARNRRLRVYA